MTSDATVPRSRAIEMRAALGLGITCTPLLLALVLAPSSGGYFITTWGLASMVALGVLAVVAVSPLATSPGVAGWVAICGFTGFAAWQGLSSAWASEPALAIENMNLTLFYGAAFTLVLLAMRRRSWLQLLTAGALALAGVVCGVALLSRFTPGLIAGDDVARLSTWLSYWNALGLLAALGAVLAIGLAADGRLPTWAQCAAGALLPAFATTLLSTFSRGAILALIIGLAVLIAAAPSRIETISFALGGLLVTLPLIMWLASASGLVALSGDVPTSDQGLTALVGLVATMAAAAAIALLASWVCAHALRDTKSRLRTGWAIGGTAFIGAVAWLVARPPTGGPIGWLQTQFDQFRSYNISGRVAAPTVTDQLATAAGTGRWQNWQVAADQFSHARVFGTGSGDFVFWWERTRGIDQKVLNAHSLYLETLGDSGLIGLALLLVPAAVVLVVGVRALATRTSTPVDRSLGVALAGCTVAALHMAGDWDWQIPTTVLPAVVLGAGVIGASQVRRSGRLRMAPAITVAGVAVVAMIVTALPTTSARAVDDARALASQGEFAAAAAKAGQAHASWPIGPAPLVLLSQIRADEGRPAAAVAELARAIAVSRGRASTWTEAAIVARGAGGIGGPRDLLAEAQARNPRDARIRTLAVAWGTGGSVP